MRRNNYFQSENYFNHLLPTHGWIRKRGHWYFLPGTHVHNSDRFSVFVLQAQERRRGEDKTTLPPSFHPSSPSPHPPPPHGNASVSRTARTGGKREVAKRTERVREKEKQGRTMCNTFFWYSWGSLQLILSSVPPNGLPSSFFFLFLHRSALTLLFPFDCAPCSFLSPFFFPLRLTLPFLWGVEIWCHFHFDANSKKWWIFLLCPLFFSEGQNEQGFTPEFSFEKAEQDGERQKWGENGQKYEKLGWGWEYSQVKEGMEQREREREETEREREREKCKASRKLFRIVLQKQKQNEN